MLSPGRLLAQLVGADDVAEEDRDGLPDLDPVVVDREGGAAGVAEARLVRIPLATGDTFGHRTSVRRLRGRAECRRIRPYTSPTVFDALSGRLQAALGDLGREGRLDEEAVSKAMREIRLALLEADVNFQVARDFVAAVKSAPSARTCSAA